VRATGPFGGQVSVVAVDDPERHPINQDRRPTPVEADDDLEMGSIDLAPDRAGGVEVGERDNLHHRDVARRGRAKRANVTDHPLFLGGQAPHPGSTLLVGRATANDESHAAE
jgi:hypothetical protein